jgi:hypothetical protein
MDFPLREEDLTMFYLHYVSTEGKQVWVTMSFGTLVINGGRMLKGIDVKLLSSCVLIWDCDRPIVGSMVLL